MAHQKAYQIFCVGKEYFAVHAEYVHNIADMPIITELEGMPSHMMGVMNLRRIIIPVINSRDKFNVEYRTITSDSCILVLEFTLDKKKMLVGLLVDKMLGVVNVGESEVLVTAGRQVQKGLQEAIVGLYAYRNALVKLLDIRRLLWNEPALAYFSEGIDS